MLSIRKLEPRHIPRDVASLCHDLEIFHGSNKPPFLFFDIAHIRKRQATTRLLEYFECMFRRCFAVGVKMLLNEAALLVFVRDRLPISNCLRRRKPFQ